MENKSCCAHCGSKYDPTYGHNEWMFRVVEDPLPKNSCGICVYVDVDKQLGEKDLCERIVKNASKSELGNAANKVLQRCAITRDEYEYLMRIAYDRQQWIAWMNKSIRDYQFVLARGHGLFERAILVTNPVEQTLLLIDPNENGEYVSSLHYHTQRDFTDTQRVKDHTAFLDFDCTNVDGKGTVRLNQVASYEAWEDQKIQDVLTVCETPIDKGFYGLSIHQQDVLMRVANWILRNKHTNGPFFDAVPCHRIVVTFTQRHINAIVASHLANDDVIHDQLINRWNRRTAGNEDGGTDEWMNCENDVVLDDVRCGFPFSTLEFNNGCTFIGEFLSNEMFIRNGGLYGYVRQLQRMSTNTSDDCETADMWYHMLHNARAIMVTIESYLAKEYVHELRQCVAVWVNQRSNWNLTPNEREKVIDYCLGINIPSSKEWWSNCNVGLFLARWMFPFCDDLPWVNGRTTDLWWMHHCGHMTIDHHPFAATVLCMTDHPALVAFPVYRVSHIESVQVVLSEHVLPELAQIITDYMYANIDAARGESD